MNLTVIQQILAPVVMISACGLLCSGLYNRLTTIVSRIRQFNRERLEHLIRQRSAGETAKRALVMHDNLLEAQIPRMLRRARLVHRALFCMLCCILGMLACSLTIGVSALVPALFPVAIGLFVAALLSMLLGIGFALREVTLSLGEVELEAQAMQDLPESGE